MQVQLSDLCCSLLLRHQVEVWGGKEMEMGGTGGTPTAAATAAATATGGVGGPEGMQQREGHVITAEGGTAAPAAAAAGVKGGIEEEIEGVGAEGEMYTTVTAAGAAGGGSAAAAQPGAADIGATCTKSLMAWLEVCVCKITGLLYVVIGM